MSRRTVRLTESELKNIITESMKNIISELDWRTYANASKKAEKFVDDNWEPDFRYFDKLVADNGLRKRCNKYDRRRDSIDKFLNMADKRYIEKYPDMAGVRFPSYVDYALKNGDEPRRYVHIDDELKNDEWGRAQDELLDFYKDKTQYTKGRGWHLKDK